MIPRALPLFLTLTLASCATALAEPRTWTDTQGREITAELVEATPASVKLRLGEKEYNLPLEKLSEADNAFVKDWLAKAAERAAQARAQQMVFGGVTIEPRKMQTFALALPPELRAEASKKAKTEIEATTIGLAVPADFDPAKSWPILVINATSGGKGSSVGHMNAYWDLATEKGWVVIAADNSAGKPPDDATSFRYAMLKAAFEQMKLKWPGSENWPLACGGNSGGAKHSGYLAAQLVRDERRVIGIFMGGCNQDTATDSFNYYTVPKREFLKVPIFLSNGLDDKIAGDPWPQRVRNSIEDTGFEHLRAERFEGGHSVDKDQVVKALDWFLELEDASRR